MHLDTNDLKYLSMHLGTDDFKYLVWLVVHR